MQDTSKGDEQNKITVDCCTGTSDGCILGMVFQDSFPLRSLSFGLRNICLPHSSGSLFHLFHQMLPCHALLPADETVTPLITCVKSNVPTRFKQYLVRTQHSMVLLKMAWLRAKHTPLIIMNMQGEEEKARERHKTGARPISGKMSGDLAQNAGYFCTGGVKSVNQSIMFLLHGPHNRSIEVGHAWR